VDNLGKPRFPEQTFKSIKVVDVPMEVRVENAIEADSSGIAWRIDSAEPFCITPQEGLKTLDKPRDDDAYLATGLQDSEEVVQHRLRKLQFDMFKYMFRKYQFNRPVS